MNTNRTYDVAIAGGGLAGLSLAIQLARKGWRVGLFEKESYPFHKVCGEYISMESRDFLNGLGLPLEAWGLPVINQLYITAPNGESIKAPLPLGGFGVSRYKLDAALANIAKEAGVDLFENTKVYDIHFEEGNHRIQTSEGLFKANLACACFGKKSNLDVKWKRHFMKYGGKQNYVGVKYHVRAALPEQEIALHNFPGGYCGISKIEDGRYCLCYLTKSENLKNNGQSIPAMEEKILKQNPALRKLLEEVVRLFDEPVTIAQISFSKKTQVENHVLCIGDAAGMITPLCGNGMSMALHASRIAAESTAAFLENRVTRDEMEKSYQENWNRQFAGRLKTGRLIQRFFGKPFWSIVLIRIMKPFPFLVRSLIRQTHGEKF
ncbi:MAG TPA: pyridine nucleotide-disulfide oxidoreductase [Chitinophagaceae bacterium]|nr:pyridine nucleotide-disulfide oxidoreductase [Chitinophagaceae bacterium]